MTAERGAARNTILSYARDLEDAEAFFKQKKTTFEKVDKHALEAYSASLSRDGLAPRTVARRLSSLRQFFHFLYTEQIRSDNPSALLESPKPGRRLPKEPERRRRDAAARGRAQKRRHPPHRDAGIALRLRLARLGTRDAAGARA